MTADHRGAPSPNGKPVARSSRRAWIAASTWRATLLRLTIGQSAVPASVRDGSSPPDLAIDNLPTSSRAMNFAMLGASTCLAVILVAIFMARVAFPAASELTHGFSAYYTAAHLLREGADLSLLYDDDWFRAQTIRLGFAGAADIYNLNPPTTALLLWPLAGLTPGLARAVWTVFSLLFLAGAIAGLLRVGGRGLLLASLTVVVVCAFQPVHEEVRLGQAYTLILGLEVVLLWAYLTDRNVVAGLALGSMLILKSAGLAIPALFIAQRRWGALAWTVLSGLSLVLFSMLLLGVNTWETYLALLPRLSSHPELAVTAYQDLPGFWSHLFRPDETWNPAPLLASPWLAGALFGASALALIGATLRLTWRADPTTRQARALSFASWSTLSLVLSPVSEDYHYTTILAPLAVLVLFRGEWQARRIILVGSLVALVLIGAPLPYKMPQLGLGAWALLAYPKLYGALLVWALALIAIGPTPSVATGSTSPVGLADPAVED